MKSLSLVIFWVIVASCLFAQKEVIVKSSTSDDKVVTVDVQKSGDNERTVKIVTNENGENKVIEWTDNGEIPDDVRKKLEDAGIDVAFIEGNEDGEMVISVDVEGEDVERDVRKEVIVIKSDDDGEVVEYEWDGEGEMPEEMKNLMKEHNIEIGELHEGHGKKHKMKMRKHKDKMKKRHKAMKDGEKVRKKEIKKYKIATAGEDGEGHSNIWIEKEDHDGESEGNIWFGSGENDDEDVIVLRGPSGVRSMGRGNSFFFKSDDKPLSNAYMGAQIESSEEGGAAILDVMKDSPADKAGLQRGDVVKRINGARVKTMDDLLGILRYFEPEDKVELTIDRGGNEKNLGLTLGKRPDAYK